MADRDHMAAGTADSIYRAPESNTAGAPKGDLLAAFLGPKNTDYYARHFGRIQAEQKIASWNWPAFFLTWPWLLYRKMWLNAALYFFVLPIVYAFLAGALIAAFGAQAGSGLYYLTWFLTAFILIPMFANWLYYRHAQGKMQKVAASVASQDEQAQRLARIGGTSSIVIVLLPLAIVAVIGILAAIAIPVYHDTTVRAQVSEGLNLSASAKAAVGEYYADTEQLPMNNEAAGLAAAETITGSYVVSVSIEAGSVLVTYGNAADAVISGEAIVLEPQELPGSLEWVCSSPTILPKHLPAACRP